MFNDVLKPQALAALKGNYDYYQTQYHDKAKLPARWHEGLEPRPHFWSVKHWNWAAKGNDIRAKPMDFLFHVLNEGPDYTAIKEFMQDLNALLNIVAAEPDRDAVSNIANQLWFGQMTWREFAKDMMRNHLRLPNAASTSLEQQDPTNVFDTLEARLVLEGYVRRHDLNPGMAWDLNDRVLWTTLRRAADEKYGPAWSWIVSQISLGQRVAEVLKAAGPWWRNRDASDEVQNAGSEISFLCLSSSNALTVMPDSGSCDRQAEPNSQTHQTAEGGAPEAGVGTAQALPEALLPNPTAPVERLAEDQFKDYLEHSSLDAYAAAMKEHFSQEHTTSIGDY
ncbi:hypothetical protein BDR03DRAFT_988461, partial [Suillus americanus]